MEPFDVYSDGVQVGISPFTIALSFTSAPQPGVTAPQAPRAIGVVRMSPEHAKVMAIILRRQLKQYEEQMGSPIPLPPQVYQQLGLSAREDW